MANKFLFATTAIALGLIAGQARAQSMDYGALEQLFGEPVTTSATGKPQKATEAPVNMTILTTDDIRRSGATDIPGVLRLVPGVDVRRYGANQVEVAIRGYNQPYSPRLLVLVNGRQVYADYFGYTNWSSVPVALDEIRQIEVVKGPNSALFGFNAVGGVVNIITYDPLKDSVNAVTARAGTGGQYGGSLVATAKAGDDFGLRFSAGGSLADQFAPRSDMSAADRALSRNPRNGFVSVDARAKLAPAVELTTEVTRSDVHQTDLTSTGGLFQLDSQATSVKAGIAADVALGLLSLDAYWNGLRPNYGTVGLFTNDSYVVRASDLFKIGSDHTLRASLEYRNNSAKDALFLGKIGYEVYAASAMWDWQVTPSWLFTSSARIDHLKLQRSGPVAANAPFDNAAYNRTTLTEPSFNVGLVWKASANDTVRLTAARGIQTPSLLNFGLMSGSSLLLLGSPKINASSILNYELGWDRQIPAIDSTIRTALFFQKSKDVVGSPIELPFTPLGGGVIGAVSRNIGSSQALGGEIGITGKSASGFRWNASYALAVINDDLSVNTGTVPWSVKDFEHGTPTHTVLLGGGYSWGRFEADLQARWQSTFTDYFGSTFNLTRYTIKDYLTVGARLGYNITDNFTVAVSGDQLNQNRLAQTAGPLVERRAIVSGTMRF